jgi:N-formylglutamate amidohydrolase
VEVKDQFGAVMRGVLVIFQVMEGGGTLPVASRQTDTMGRARIPWILGSQVGEPQRIRATAGNLTAEFQATAVEATPGASFMGRNGYTEYLPGELPLVLSAPHGGDQTPSEIPDRTFGTTVTDRNTRELALQIRSAIKAQTGFYPHLIISHLKRTKLDPNREIIEAAQGDPEGERAWYEFQTFIDAAGDAVENEFGEGFYIDLHGHGHEIQRLELGYLLSSSDLSNADEVLADPAFVNKSSYKVLGSKPGMNFADLIRGPMSLGTLMELEGVPAVPSQNQPNPGGNSYFTGGYNTRRHGSRDRGAVSGVQIECNYTGVRDTEANRQAMAEALGRALAAFFPEHLGFPLAPLSGAAAEK